MSRNQEKQDDDGARPPDRDLDPEYHDLLSQQNKQQRLFEHGGNSSQNIN